MLVLFQGFTFLPQGLQICSFCTTFAPVCDVSGSKWEAERAGTDEMKDYPQTNDPNLRELLRSQLDDMIRFTNHSSDIGRTHIGYLELAKKALQ